jgi:hypothetical protein
VLCYCPIEQIKNSIMPFVRKRQAHSCHYCYFFLSFFSISWLVIADHINLLSAICLFISAWTGSDISLCRKCCAVHTYNYRLTKREKKAVNTQETESFWSGKWSLSTSAKRKKSIYIGSHSFFLFRWSDEYGHLFPSSITDGWIITKKKQKKKSWIESGCPSYIRRRAFS